MYHPAIQVLYSNIYFGSKLTDLWTMLSFLRDTIPREAIYYLRRIKFTLMPAQCAGWDG